MTDLLLINRPALGYVSVPSLAREIESRSPDVTTRTATLRQGDIVPPAEMYLRWGCTHSLGNRDAKVLNSAKAIHRVSNKALFRRETQDVSPTTWWHWADVPNHEGHFADGMSVIVRPSRHAGGRNLYHCTDMTQVMNAVEQCGPDYYISEYIKKEREFRVHCVQGRVVGVSEKHPPNREAIAWNFHGEDGNGEFINLKWSEWPMAVVNAALEAFKVSKLHFGAADVISVPGRALVLEINSAPSLSPYRASCYARALSDSITKGRLRTDEYEPPVQPQTWKHAIHPALME